MKVNIINFKEVEDIVKLYFSASKIQGERGGLRIVIASAINIQGAESIWAQLRFRGEDLVIESNFRTWNQTSDKEKEYISKELKLLHKELIIFLDMDNMYHLEYEDILKIRKISEEFFKESYVLDDKDYPKIIIKKDEKNYAQIMIDRGFILIQENAPTFRMLGKKTKTKIRCDIVKVANQISEKTNFKVKVIQSL